jgi:hypothetical protein
VLESAVSLVYLPHSLRINLPADMIDDMDRDEAMEGRNQSVGKASGGRMRFLKRRS